MGRKHNDIRRLPKRRNLVFITIKGLKRSKSISELQHEDALDNKGEGLLNKSHNEKIDAEGDFDE